MYLNSDKNHKFLWAEDRRFPGLTTSVMKLVFANSPVRHTQVNSKHKH